MHAWKSWMNAWRNVEETQAEELEQIPSEWVRPAIVAASAAALFIEMVMVRWHGTCFHAFAIFKNVSLLSCFLGLGIGFALSGRPGIRLARFLPLLALQTVLFGVLSCTNLGGRIVNPLAEQLVMGRRTWSILYALEGNAFLLIVFAINAWMFIPVGHLVGRLMNRLPRTQAYSLNLIGSLLGIGGFFVLSLLWCGPEIWMGGVILVMAAFLAGSRRMVGLGAACTGLILVSLGVISGVKGLTFYSPYQVIAYELAQPEKSRWHPTIRVNHCYYQGIFDCLSPTDADPETTRAKLFYGLPYRLQKKPGDVLVVGAGTGNDVAAALRYDARTVTAVELDPAILDLGRKVHPEHPYQDTRTKAVVNDARTFIRQTDQKFDTIIYGLLDSHTNLGAMTNVRVDSFVYTVEAFREAIGRLNDDGLVIVSYTLLNPLQGQRLYGMLQKAHPDNQPRAFCIPGGLHDGGTTFVAGPGLKRLPAEIPGVLELTNDFTSGLDRADLATDDWPFFYMKNRSYPFSYLIMIGLMLVVSIALIRRNLGTIGSPNPSWGLFFFLGAGFMLIETKGITELGLTFGNTWSVVMVVITSIMLMGYLANRVVMRFGAISSDRAFALLAGSLAIGWGVNVLALHGTFVPWIVLPVVLTMPLFFAGLIFSSSLERASDIGSALSANILGAMLGGFLEYNSMYWGYSSLYPLGLGLYTLAFVCHRAGQKASAAHGQSFPALSEAA